MAADLEGKTVVLTRAEEDAASMRGPLEERGARVVLVPALRVEALRLEPELSQALAALPRTAWVAFASRNGVRFFARLLEERGAAPPEGIRLAAIGPGTAREIERRLRPPDLVASVSTAEGLARSLISRADAEAGEVLLPSARDGRRVLESELAAAGFRVRRLPVYLTRCAVEGDGPVDLPPRVDYVIFTSPSTVRGFLALAPMPPGAQAVSIGPTTSRAARDAGLEPIREACTHDLQGVLEVIP